MARFMSLTITVCMLLCIAGCGGERVAIGIMKQNPPASFFRDPMTDLPSYNPDSDQTFQIDVRNRDISGLSLEDRLADLMHADFDTLTVWPDKLPQGFDPEKFMELGKDPGLNIRKLHEKGIIGKGISIAIIDQTLLTDHEEYKNNLKHYEEINSLELQSSMHGSAVSSIAVGKTVGVAPGADLYYIGCTPGNYKSGAYEYDFSWLAKAVDRIVQINKQLPRDKKIRVLSMSIGWSESQTGYKEIVKAVEKAKKAGIFVVSSSLYPTYDNQFFFNGLGRDPNLDPNDPNSYAPGSWWAESFFSGSPFYPEKFTGDFKPLMVPMDSRCTASFTGINDYVFYPEGGWSWSIPYIAGVYALACQVRSDVTPEKFWSEAISTGDTIDIEKDGQTYKFGVIMNPVRLMEALAE